MLHTLQATYIQSRPKQATKDPSTTIGGMYHTKQFFSLNASIIKRYITDNLAIIIIQEIERKISWACLQHAPTETKPSTFILLTDRSKLLNRGDIINAQEFLGNNSMRKLLRHSSL